MVMRQMRASAKWIMGVVVVSFVGWGVFSGVKDITGSGTSGGSTDTALRINGVKVDYQSFLFAVRNAQERQRNQTGSAPVTLEDQRRLEDQVVEQMVQGVILDQEYKRRGITVTDAEIRSAAQVSPPPEIMGTAEFQTDGQFDLTKYQRYIASGADPQFLATLENLYRTEIPRVKLYEQLSGSVYVPDTQLWRMYQDANDSVKVVVLAVLTRTAFNDGQTVVTEEEARRYYDDHTDEFEQAASAYTSYVRTSRELNSYDSTATLELATLLYHQVNADGVDFATIARRESADSTSRVNGGDLGETQWGRFVPEFEEAVRALRPGQISAPVASPFGYHIIKLESKDSDGFHASHILIAFELRDDHLAEVEDKADTLDLFGAEQDEPSALDAVADKLGLEITAASVLRQGSRMVVEGEAVPDVAIWAFETSVGTTSLVYEAPRHFYLFRLDSLQEAHTLTFEDVEETIRSRLLVEKNEQRAKDLATEIRQRLVQGAAIEAIAAEVIGLSIDTLGPFTRLEPGIEMRPMPEAIGAAFGQGIDAYSKPIASENRNVYIIKTIARFTSDSTAFLQQLDAQRQQVTPVARDARIRMFLASLRDAATIVDRRREIEANQRELAESNGLLPRGF